MLRQLLATELLWVLVAGVIAAAVVLPPYLTHGSFYYLRENLALVFAFVTVLRLLFFHAQSPWLRPMPSKAAVCVATLPLGLFAVLTINNVQTLVDAYGFDGLFRYADGPDVVAWGRYLRNEVLFFGSGLLVCLVILPAILVVAVWRQVKAKNRRAI